ncbi:hypothetical protein BS50DRAFT_631862 [Corynespora cassiicola Philippines]|uniref:Uncharacterized protein n=1 Tax=Corynespora cassiicola Philippines TaxID=1448308 RepID=A0A2T2NWU9_CORCC|nr:hypothetical protein BS50DRAFT_631862 [Corynespora cassiicola Philippines]
MSSRASYSSAYAQDKGAYAHRSSSPRSTSSRSTSSSTSSRASSSLYAHSAHSSRNYRYGSKPPVIHNGGGQSNDPNTSTSASNSGYYN